MQTRNKNHISMKELNEKTLFLKKHKGALLNSSLRCNLHPPKKAKKHSALFSITIVE